MKHFNFLKSFALGLLLIYFSACKKETSLPSRSIIPQGDLTTLQGKPKAKFSTNTNTFYKNIPIVFTNASVSPDNDVSYLWQLITTAGVIDKGNNADTLQLLFNAPQECTIRLIVSNKFGADTVEQTIEVKDVPKYARITAIKLDTLGFTNPSTGNPWNPTGGPNVLYKFYDQNSIWIDSVDISLNGNLYGWISPLAVIQQPYLVLNNVSALPSSWNYPSGLKYILFNKMLDNTSLRIYNKNTLGVNEIMGEMEFKFIDFFRKPEYIINTNDPDFIRVSLRSTDGKIVVTIDIKFLT